MTTTMTSSLFGLEDMEALLWAPSSPTVDALMFDREQPQTAGGGVASLEVDASPASPLAASSLSSSSSPPPFYSPPPSPPAPLLLPPPYKELLTFPWLSEPLRSSQTLAEEDDLSDLDWMDERMDLSPFDLDSLIGSCVPAEDPAASPDDLLATLDCPMELEPLPLPLLPVEPLPAPSDPPAVAVATESCTEERDVPSSPLYVPEPQEELEIKSEPASPGVDSASSPAYTLDLGSEVDVSDTEVKPVAAPAPVVAAPAPVVAAPAPVVPQLPRIVLSLPTTRIVLLLAPKKEVTPKVVRCSPPPSPPQRPAPRCRPYPDPVVARVTIKTPRGAERAVAKTPKDKKYKKMEQNKTAATRYRQKKRAETSALGDELAALERKNLELTERAESTEREIQYLKELMEEVSLARLRKELAAAP